MWKIIKAEIQYYRTIYFSIFILVILLLCINTLWVKNDAFILQVLFFMFPLLGITVGTDEGKTKRGRFYATLPISIRNVGYAKYPLWILFWIIIMLLYLLSKSISIQQQLFMNDVWIAVSLTGAILVCGSGMLISHDLTYSTFSNTKRYSLKLLCIIFVGVAFMFYFFTASNGKSFQPVNSKIIEAIFSPITSMIVLFIGIIFTLVSYRTFLTRTSYLD